MAHERGARGKRGQQDVEQYDVEGDLLEGRARLAGTRCGTDDPHVICRVDELGEGTAHSPVVVDDQHTDDSVLLHITESTVLPPIAHRLGDAFAARQMT